MVLPPPVEAVLQSGVLIVISKASQQMFVFKDGQPWRTSPVSTGRRGHATPAGVFPILQKKVFHRSNIYSGAPMPYMQRLTWTGIAIHAGRLPGYPASHGCIRLPREFARALYGLTRASATTVVIANDALRTDDQAQRFALNAALPSRAVPGGPTARPAPRLAAAQAEPRIVPLPVVAVNAPALPQSAVGGRMQTIQLAAAPSAAEAEAHWARLIGARPELGQFEKVVIPAVVKARRVYRLRVSASGAHATCASLKSAGIDCFNVS